MRLPNALALIAKQQQRHTGAAPAKKAQRQLAGDIHGDACRQCTFRLKTLRPMPSIKETQQVRRNRAVCWLLHLSILTKSKDSVRVFILFLFSQSFHAYLLLAPPTPNRLTLPDDYVMSWIWHCIMDDMRCMVLHV